MAEIFFTRWEGKLYYDTNYIGRNLFSVGGWQLGSRQLAVVGRRSSVVSRRSSVVGRRSSVVSQKLENRNLEQWNGGTLERWNAGTLEQPFLTTIGTIEHNRKHNRSCVNLLCPSVNCQLPTAYCLLPTAYCLLPTAASPA